MLQLTNAAVSTSLLQPVQGVCVFSTFSRSFYPSTSSTPRVRADPWWYYCCSRGVRHVWSRNCDTEMLPPGTCYIIQDICADAHRSVKAIPRLMCENAIVTCWMQKICLRLEAEVSLNIAQVSENVLLAPLQGKEGARIVRVPRR